ncbi:heavy metal translocating P-type ATPase [Nocardia sp. NPDC051833]|uniref:heavy metal translocating P-type ATPase n=1 Tax=Nocardia sp. NPDC051833 TaxID=3155674 RepID=UPI00343227CB
MTAARGSTARTGLFAIPEMRWAAAAIALFALGLTAKLTGGPDWLWWALLLACYLVGGWEPGLEGLKALRDKTLDVDLLMVAAALGAAAIGQVVDGALLIVIFATSGALEALATTRTEDSVRGLLTLAPETATQLTDDGEQTVAAADLAVGDVILVRPGDRIAADGRVVDGASEVDQATITGEPLPIDKATGDEVFAGTLNGTGALRVRVERRAADSVVARIAALVEEAGRTKARTQLFIEKIEQRYSIGMVVATLAVFTVPLILGAALRDSLLRAMTFMIVASPCAVVLATMPPLLAAIATAGRHGVLVKSAVVMEQLGATTVVAFDKTGTLTRGTPELVAIQPLPGSAVTEEQVLRLAAAVEHPSEHPLAAAIVRAARQRGLVFPAVRDFTAYPGRGVSGLVDGSLVRVSSPTVLADGDPRAAATPAGHDAVHETADSDNGVAHGDNDTEAWGSPAIAAQGSGDTGSAGDPTGAQHASTVGPPPATVADIVAMMRARGHTAVLVLRDDEPVAVLAFTDQIRPEAADAVAALAASTGSAPVLLTGDHHATADRLARRLGIDEVRAGLLPHDKVAAVRELAADGSRVTMVGDGINDAPALAAAHVGIAMGGVGSDLTVQTADAIVVRDELTTIPTVIALSRRARRVVLANLAIAAGFLGVLVLWDLIWHLPLPLGVLGHEGSTVIVGLNGLRLLRSSAWRRAHEHATGRR